MRIEVITLLPEVFMPYLQSSILGRALAKQLLSIHLHNLRDFTEDKHRTTDDIPFGGGGGMVLKIEPLAKALRTIAPRTTHHRILLTPQGRLFRQPLAKQLVQKKALCLVCGRYEGFDERVRDLVDDEISLGDFVLTGGELASLAIIDAVARLIPGVLGNESSAPQDSHENGLLEYPHYTRPRSFQGRDVPKVLLEGNHAKIQRFRRQESLYRTWERRPDLFALMPLSKEDRMLLAEARNWRTEGVTEEMPSSPSFRKSTLRLDNPDAED